MDFVPYRLLRNQPTELRRKLEEQGELVVTVNGEPMAIMLQVPEGNLDELVLLISQVRAKLAVANVREQARQRGLDRLTPDEIDAVIEQARQDRGITGAE
jgi:hypothetical protein